MKITSLNSNSLLCCFLKFIFFTATVLRDCFSMAEYTTAVEPSPIFFRMVRAPVGSPMHTTSWRAAYKYIKYEHFRIASYESLGLVYACWIKILYNSFKFFMGNSSFLCFWWFNGLFNFWFWLSSRLLTVCNTAILVIRIIEMAVMFIRYFWTKLFFWKVIFHHCQADLSI